MNLWLQPDPTSELLGTGYQWFVWRDCVHGLCKEDGGLQILAIASLHERQGNVRAFFDEAKQDYSTIRVWHVYNPIMEDALIRWGFRKWSERMCFQGEWETCEGYRWDK